MHAHKDTDALRTHTYFKNIKKKYNTMERIKIFQIFYISTIVKIFYNSLEILFKKYQPGKVQKDKIIEHKREEQKINYACQVSKVFKLETTERRRGGERKG